MCDADRPDADRPDADRPDADRLGLEPPGLVITAAAAADTKAFGASLAEVLRPGDLIVLTGPLGAGKTALTQGIGAGLGVSGPVLSPTFVLARVHPDGRIPLIHVDAYRLGSLVEVDDLDLDISVADGVTVVEWGAGLVEQLADDYLRIELDRSDDSEIRTIRTWGSGGDWDARLRRLAG